MDESWMDELRDLDGALRPTAEALPAVQERVRRRRRVRAFGGALGVTGLVAAVTAAAVIIPNHGAGPGSVGPVAGTPSETPTPTPVPGKVSPNFDCGHGAGRVDIFTTAPPPIDADDLAQQQALIGRIKARDWPGFRITGAEPTHLGVVALVDDHYEKAKETLEPEGVRMVALTASELGNAHEQAMNFIQELLEPALEEVNRTSRSVPGIGSIAVWSEGGAVVVDWKAPIPDEVMALAGVRDDGVRVIVQPSRYSEADVNHAVDRVQDAFKSHQVDAKWTSATGCDDGSGVVIGIQPDSLGNRKAELEKQLTVVAGMPVHVIAEEPIDDLM